MKNGFSGGQRARMPWIERYVKTVLEALYPTQCVSCNALADAGICAACNRSLLRVENPCPQCGASIGYSGGNQVCGRCRRRPPAYDLTVTPFLYAPPLSSLVHQFKYRGKIGNARPLAKIFCREFTTRYCPLPQLLVPVPLHWTRLIRRGFNQSAELCRHLSAELSIPFDRSTVYRTRKTLPQVELPLNQRRWNVRGCFELRRPLPVESIAIVDDVITSGETMHQIASMLKNHGVTAVQAWAILRTDV